MRSQHLVIVNTQTNKIICKDTCKNLNNDLDLFNNIETFLQQNYGVHNLVSFELVNTASADGTIKDYKCIINLK